MRPDRWLTCARYVSSELVNFVLEMMNFALEMMNFAFH